MIRRMVWEERGGAAVITVTTTTAPPLQVEWFAEGMATRTNLKSLTLLYFISCPETITNTIQRLPNVFAFTDKTSVRGGSFSDQLLSSSNHKKFAVKENFAVADHKSCADPIRNLGLRPKETKASPPTP